MPSARIGVIGGTGLYKLEGLTEVEEVVAKTPFGDPSDAIVVGKLGDVSVAFLPRHGRKHQFSPTSIPARANIYALKALGVEHLISVSAVGSMRLDIEPLDIVVPDQIFDRTVCRARSFFEDGPVVHISFAEPFCPELRRLVVESAQASGAEVHDGGTYLCIEGPQFSTKAESRVYRSWGVDVIGMTAIPEAKLAREAEMCYAMLAMSTDYDVWHESEEAVTAEMIMRNLDRNVSTARRTLQDLIPRIPVDRPCTCALSLENAILTPAEAIAAKRKEELSLLIGKYVR